MYKGFNLILSKEEIPVFDDLVKEGIQSYRSKKKEISDEIKSFGILMVLLMPPRCKEVGFLALQLQYSFLILTLTRNLP